MRRYLISLTVTISVEASERSSQTSSLSQTEIVMLGVVEAVKQSESPSRLISKNPSTGIGFFSVMAKSMFRPS